MWLTKRFISIFFLIGVIPSSVQAAAFQQFATSTTVVGNFGAGVAAEASDASVNFYNPAGLTQLDQPQLVLTGNFARVTSALTGTATYNGAMPPAYTQTANNLKSGSWNPLPAIHYAMPLTDRIVAGLSVTVPFSDERKYSQNSPVRYLTTETEIITVDLNPTIAIRLTDKLSVGAGFTGQAGKFWFDQVTGDPTVDPSLDTTENTDGISWAFGWTAGMLYNVTDHTRFGLSYRSNMQHKINGKNNITGPLAPDDRDEFDIFGDVTLPSTTTASVYHAFNDQWALLGSIFYTQWDVFDGIIIRDCDTGEPVIADPQQWRNTWRVAVGANYTVNDRWLLRTGMGYDQTPTRDDNRSVRFPDGDRFGIAVGTRIQASERLWVDVGYTHLFIKDVDINDTQGKANFKGRSKNQGNIFGVQLVWDLNADYT